MSTCDRDSLVQAKMVLMNNDAKKLHSLVKERNIIVKRNEEIVAKENRDRMSHIDQIRSRQIEVRTAKEDKKEKERSNLSRTMMANLVSSSDYPGCPPYVPHMINVMKNVMGNKALKYINIYIFK